MKPWEQVEPPEEIKVGWRKLTKKMFELPNGKVEEFTTFGSASDVHAVVIALTPEGKVVVAEQFRPGPELIMQDLPGGSAEHRDEDPLNLAKRELAEETGYTSDNWEFLGSVSKDGYINGCWNFYIAYNCVKSSGQALDDNEFVEVKLINIDQLIDNAKVGRMTDANAVLMAYDKLMEVKAKNEKTN